MKAFFVTALLVLTVAGCSTWGSRTATPSDPDASGVTPSPTGVSSHDKADG